jgi:putative ABC transport system permease protein
MAKRVYITDLFREAMRVMRENLLRTFLTVLGITIGVTSLITVMTVIEGATDYVADEIADLGSNVFQVTKVANISEGIDEVIKSFRRKNITWENYLFVRDHSRWAVRVGAQASMGGTVRFGNAYIQDSRVDGATANMIDISTRELVDGRFFTEQESQFARRVCVVGWDIRERLFPGQDPVGKYLKIADMPFRIVGVCKKLGSVLGQTQDNFVMIPLAVFFKMYGSQRSLDLFVQTASPETFGHAMDEVRVFLRVLRGRKYEMKDDFSINTADTTMKLFEDIMGNFFMVFLMLSAVAAIVGGIVIMNIMLVSVTDRVNEIGVRRAVGAAQGDILAQFLLESLLICTVGGVLGVLLGFGAAEIFSRLADVPAGVKVWVAAFGVGLSSLIGLFFGIYPAWRAARLDPVEALRAER